MYTKARSDRSKGHPRHGFSFRSLSRLLTLLLLYEYGMPIELCTMMMIIWEQKCQCVLNFESVSDESTVNKWIAILVVSLVCALLRRKYVLCLPLSLLLSHSLSQSYFRCNRYSTAWRIDTDMDMGVASSEPTKSIARNIRFSSDRNKRSQIVQECPPAANTWYTKYPMIL